jgi:hypothetical protein
MKKNLEFEYSVVHNILIKTIRESSAGDTWSGVPKRTKEQTFCYEKVL